MTTHKCRKRFGQNFLRDSMFIAKIVHAIGPTVADSIIEIGPGAGAITAPLLPAVAKLTAIELDRDLIPKLTQQFASYNNFILHQSDILKFDLNKIFEDSTHYKIVGNLPYNISTPVLFYLLQYLPNIHNMHFMLQKEVALRLAALPGNKDYGRLSVMIQYHCHVEILFAVPPTAFQPIPKVDSAFVRLTPISRVIAAANLNNLKDITTLAFNQRRKTIQNSLKNMFSKTDFLNLNIDPCLRPEQLTIENYISLSNYTHKT